MEDKKSQDTPAAAIRKENRKAVRVKVNEPLHVLLGSIGSEMRYKLLSRDLSMTGFFLDFEKPGRFPFGKASILEVWLQYQNEEPIFFNGKVARVVMPEKIGPKDPGPGIGIKIVQIDKENEKKFKELYDSIAAQTTETIKKTA